MMIGEQVPGRSPLSRTALEGSEYDFELGASPESGVGEPVDFDSEEEPEMYVQSESERVKLEQQRRAVEDARSLKQEWEDELRSLAETPGDGDREHVLRQRMRKLEDMETRLLAMHDLESAERDLVQVINEDRQDQRNMRLITDEIEKLEDEYVATSNSLAQQERYLHSLLAEQRVDPSDETQQKIDLIQSNHVVMQQGNEDRKQKLEEAKAVQTQLGEQTSQRRKKSKRINQQIEEKTADVQVTTRQIIENPVVLASDWRGESKTPEPVPTTPDRIPPTEKDSVPSPMKKAESKKTGNQIPLSRKIVRGVGTVGAMSALGTGLVAGGILQFAGRFGKNFFKGIKNFLDNPVKFVENVWNKFASEMDEPPKGKGAFKGLVSGAKWFFIGEKPYEPKKSDKE